MGWVQVLARPTGGGSNRVLSEGLLCWPRLVGSRWESKCSVQERAPDTLLRSWAKEGAR